MLPSGASLLFELNEVPFPIVDAFRRWRPDSCLARMLPRCGQYETVAEDDCAGIPHKALSPWITWPSLHRGVVHGDHGVSHLGQDLREIDTVYPPLWKLLQGQHVRTGVFGPLHSYPPPGDAARYAFFMPDTFAAGPEAHPVALSSFQRFNLAMVGASARNVSKGLDWRGALRLLRDVPTLGVRSATLGEIGVHLARERVQPWLRGRRRTYQVVLAFDIYMKLLERTRPAFSNFFTNHVASAMHRYWAATFPDQYEEFNFDDEWVRTYRHEIEFAMAKFDGFLARLVAWTDREPGRRLLVTSSMGQGPTETRAVRTQLYARAAERFMERLGVGATDWERRPAMEPDLNVFVAEGRRQEFRRRLETLRLGGDRIRFDERELGFFSVILGHTDVPEQGSVELDGDRLSPRELGLENIEIDDGAGSSAFHVPEGILLIYRPDGPPPETDRRRVSALEIAPYLLRAHSVTPPPYMRTGDELLERP